MRRTTFRLIRRVRATHRITSALVRFTHPTCLVILGLLVASTAVAWAEEKDPKPEIAGVRVGFAGNYKVGTWTPVRVLLRDKRFAAGEVSVTVPDGEGVPSRVSAPVADGQDSVLLYVRFGRIDSPLDVELRAGERVARRVFGRGDDGGGVAFRQGIAGARKVIVTVGADTEGAEPLGVEDAVGLLRLKPQQRPAVVRVKDTSELPTRWYGYEGVDTLVLATGRPEIYKKDRFTTEQVAALDRWITMGGRLVLCVGDRARDALGPESRLGRFAPGGFRTTDDLLDLGALERYAVSSVPIPRPAGRAEAALRVPRLSDVEGVVEASELDLPLVVRTARGFGQIVFLATDLDRPPLRKWDDRPGLVAKLLDLPTARPEESAGGAAVMHLGYDDLSGQLRSALDQFDDVRLVPFWGVAVLIGAYVLLIGPVDYFLLRRYARRMQWTWVTFPSMVMGACLAAWGLSYFCKGTELRVNQADLVDVDTATGLVRGTSWANVFSPRTEAFDLALAPNVPDVSRSPGGPPREEPHVLLAWLGLPGEALGAMNARAVNPVEWTEWYAFSPKLDRMLGVPIPVWSTRSFTARWTAEIGLSVEADLREEDGMLAGTITNRLSFPLEGCLPVGGGRPVCLLAYDRWVYRFEALKAGATIHIGPEVKSSELETLLTGRRIVSAGERDAYRIESTEYDRSSVEIPYILRMMTFFAAAGGRKHARLSHGYQGFVDLSGLLKTGRAVLVVQAPVGRHGAEMRLAAGGETVTGETDKHVTFYRFVLPVEAGKN